METLGDILGIFYGLSRAAIETAAYGRIHDLAACGFKPAEIVERMEPPKRKKEQAHDRVEV